MHAHIVFLGVDGFDVRVGLTTPNVLKDSSKFNRRSLSLIVPASAIDHVITDSDLPPEEVKAIQDIGIGVTVV
jgi:DeoR family transcriptional regulator of aga operon